MIRESYIERMIRQIAQLVAAVMDKRKGRDHAGAQEDLARAYALLLGEQQELLDLVDSATLVRLFGPAERLRSLALVCYAEGQLLEDRGEATAAQRRFRQAKAIFAEVGADTLEERAAAADLLARPGV